VPQWCEMTVVVVVASERDIVVSVDPVPAVGETDGVAAVGKTTKVVRIESVVVGGESAEVVETVRSGRGALRHD